MSGDCCAWFAGINSFGLSVIAIVLASAPPKELHSAGRDDMQFTYYRHLPVVAVGDDSILRRHLTLFTSHPTNRYYCGGV